jgi:hypothetical protein
VQSLHRMIAAIVMVVAVIGILAALVGLVAVWVVRARWAADAAVALDGLAAELRDANSALQDVGSRMAATRDNLTGISATAGGVGDKLTEPSVVELAQGVQDTLSQVDGKVQEANGRLRELEAGVNKIVDLANKLPGVEVPALDVKLLDGVSGLLVDASGRVKELGDEASGGKVTVTQEMAGIEQSVQRLQGDVGAAESSVAAAGARLAAAQGRLETWKEQLPKMLLESAVVLTVGLLWFLAGQVGLFMWMWSAHRRAGATGETL